MNKYGRLAMTHWQEVDPERVEALEDSETFFEDLGEEVLSRIDVIASSLESADRRPAFLQEVGRRSAIRYQAEELALTELVWIEPGGVSLTEFESSEPDVSSLVNWVTQVQDDSTGVWAATMPETAQRWSLSLDFLRRMIASENPWEFLEWERAELRESLLRRYAAATAA